MVESFIQKKRKMKKTLLLIVSLFIVAFTFVQAADLPYFYFQSNAGNRLKLYCNNNLEMWVDAWVQKYNWFESYIKFDTWDIQITSVNVNSDFSNGQKNELFWNMYHVWWAMPWWFKTNKTQLVNLNYRTLKNITWTTFSIKDMNWINNYWLQTTADWLTLNWYDVSSKDILTWVENLLLEYYAYPCVIDAKNPTIWNLIKIWTNENINWVTKVPENQVISFDTYDWDVNHKVDYWFWWNDTTVLSNYVVAPSTVDNQEWVNSGTISVKVSCENCSTSRSNVEATLTVSDWNWTTDKNALTWDSERRWYNVSFNAPFPYEVEKKVTISVSVSDNPNENWATHTGTKIITFNAPVLPTITMLEPINTGFSSPSKNNPLKFYFSDDWAGVDSGTISLEIKAITWNDDEIIMTGYIYSGSDLSIVLSGWSEWIWNEAKYEVEFYPKRDFPENNTITIIAFAKDLAGNEKIQRFTINTRQTCAFYGCRETTNIFGPVWIDIWHWFEFTGSVLIVSGYANHWDNIYPYLSGNELICRNSNWDWLVITWEVVLYDENDNLLWFSTQYQNNELYVTWNDDLDIYLDENGKVKVKRKN